MSRHMTIDDLATIATPEQPALSPDGTTIAYVLRTLDLEHDRNAYRLWQVDVDGTAERPITAGPADTAPAWSPDGTRIAFLRATDGPGQIWLLPQGGRPTRLTTLILGAGAPVWSPDGTRIAFTAPVDLAAVDGEDDEARSRRQYAPVVADRINYFADGEGLVRTVRRHVHVLDLASGRCTRITDGDWNAGAPTWSPDGTAIAFPAAMDADADLTRLRAAYVVDLGSGDKAPRLVGSPTGWTGPMSWTSDGTALLIAGTTGPPNGHFGLLRVAIADGATTNLAAGMDRNVMFGSPGYPGATPRAVPGERTVLFCARDRESTPLYAVNEDGGAPAPVVAGTGHNVSGLSIAAGRAAFVLTTPTSFGEIVSVDLGSGAETVHTTHGSDLDEVTLYPRIEREFEISDGRTVHGFLIRDPEAAGPRPLLLDMHGGPHNAWNTTADDTHLYQQELVAQGWNVLLINPRASDGYGEDFFTAAVGGWGITDAKDFLEPLDLLIAEGIADPDRLAVTGYSYGGYMTCYLTSHDDRFAAAIGGGVVSDLTSQAGTADNGHSCTESEFGGRPWDGRERYAAMSPISRVEHVRTPTLLLQGGDDVRCPVGQAQQWHTALRELGIPTRLVLYPGSSHVFIVNGRPSHRLDYNRRVMDWLERYVG